MEKVKKGDIVAVTFFDHVQSPKESPAMSFIVYGRVASVSARALVVGSWCHFSTRRKYDENTTTFTIVRSAIESISILAPKDSSA